MQGKKCACVEVPGTTQVHRLYIGSHSPGYHGNERLPLPGPTSGDSGLHHQKLKISTL